MKRKRSNSQQKTSKKKIIPKKKLCSLCGICVTITILMQNALYRKYSSNHFTEHQLIDNSMKKKRWQRADLSQQYMQKYYKESSRKQHFPNLLQIHRLYKNPPILLLTDISKLLIKCHYRKRLVQYFKIAKILGIKLDTIKFSTFILSLNHTPSILNTNQENYDPIIGHISGYDFTQNVQLNLVQTLYNKENNNNPQMQHCKHNQKKQKLTTNYHNNNVFHLH